MPDNPWPTILDNLPEPEEKSLDELARELRELEEYERELREKLFGDEE